MFPVLPADQHSRIREELFTEIQPMPATREGQRLLGKSIALLSLTALLAYGCERAKQNPPADATPKPAPAAQTPATTPADAPKATTEPAKPTDTKPQANGDDVPKLPPIPHTDLTADAKALNDMTTPSGVTVQVMKDGAGLPTFPKAVVTIHLVMHLKDGWKKLESTYEGGEPITTRLDAPPMVEGLADGLVGMKVGEVRRVIVPPALAYGKEGVESKEEKGTFAIPPGAVLVYDVELVSVKQVLAEPSKPKPKPAAAPGDAAPPAGK
jgi:FKBP-type peptidyl-prolyl cis-trans isomerase